MQLLLLLLLQLLRPAERPTPLATSKCVKGADRKAKAREKREKLFFFSTRNECIEKKYKPPHSSVSRSMPSQGHIWLH